MLKRLLSMLLCMCMMMSLLPVSALAADDVGRSSALEWFNSNKRQPEDGLDEEKVETSVSDGVEPVPVTAPVTSETVKSAPGPQSVTSASGQCGDNVYWNLSSDGILTISGTGAMKDYASVDNSVDLKTTADNPVEWDDVKIVIIEDGVTSIGNRAFSGCTELFEIEIPNSVTSIGESAFYSCGLIKITIPNSVTSIGDSAFYCCHSLTEIAIPDSVTVIKRGAFADCTSLTEITIPNSVRVIEGYVFKCCSRLTKISIPNSVIIIGSEAFEGCSSLAEITIPDSVTRIGSFAFAHCTSLTEITIPDSVTVISDHAFDRCTSLAKVKFLGTEEQWNAIWIGSNNSLLKKAKINFSNRDVAEDGMPNDVQTLSGTVEYLAGWDEDNRRVYFGSSNGIGYSVDVSVAESDVNSINQLVGKYVLVHIDSRQATTITFIKPVESKVGTCSTVGKDMMTIDGVEYAYPTNDGLVLDLYVGKEVLYHLNEGNIVGVRTLDTKKGKLTNFDDKTQQVVIDGVEYYLNSLSGVRDFNQLIGQKIVFSTINSTTDRPLLNAKIFVPQSKAIQFTTSLSGNSVVIGTEFDLYVGYYLDNQLDTDTKTFDLTITNTEIASISDEGWSDTDGRHYKITAKKKGETTISTLMDGETKEFKLYVFDTNMVFTLDTVPKMIIEEGKTTNFYNYSGLVVDDFNPQPQKDNNGNVLSYNVSMTVYNTHNTYAAVSSYDSDGVLHEYAIIDRKPALTTSFVGTLEELSHQIGDIFHWFENHKYYSGESVSKETHVEIEVPAGGHLWISNNPTTSEVVMLANNIAIITDALMMVYTISKNAVGMAKNAADMADVESQIIWKNIDSVLKSIEVEMLNKSPEYVGEKIPDWLKDASEDTMKSGNWDFNSMADYFNGILERFSDFGLNIVEEIEDDLCSITGVRKATESAALKIIPTGDLIKFLYSLNDGGNFISFFIVQLNSSNFPKGIYIYAPKKSDENASSYDSVINRNDPLNHASRSPASNLKNSSTNNTVNKGKGPDSMSVESPNKISTKIDDTTHSSELQHNQFIDIDEKIWYYPAVCYVYENNLMTGAENSYTFAPNANLSRSMLAQILYNREGKPAVTKSSDFSDVPQGAWYEDAVTWASEKGIVSGYEDGRFASNDPVTREQFAVMLWRYSGSPSTSTENLKFSDITSVRSYALEAMAWAVSNNIISGYEDGRLAPAECASRAQVAQMLKNYLDK